MGCVAVPIGCGLFKRALKMFDARYASRGRDTLKKWAVVYHLLSPTKWLVTRTMSAHKARFVPPPPSCFPSPAGNGQWINSGETRASVKQICDGEFIRAWVIFGRRGGWRVDGRKEKERKEKYRFCWTARDIVKKKKPSPPVTLLFV